MKKRHILCGLMLMTLMLLAGCSPDNRVIDKPVFLASNTTSIEVNKVTLTDSTTVLDIFARYRPKWWIRIDPNSFLTDDKGKTYPISQGVGIELGKEFWMPATGEAEFQLVFPRLRNGAKFFHFSEAPGMEGGFKIWGVQLQGNQLPELPLPKDVQAQPVDKDAQLEVPGLEYGEATLKGKLFDYLPGMADVVQMMVCNPLVGLDDEVEVKIEPDGSFTHTMPVLGTSKAYLFLKGMMNGQAEIFLAPGQTSEVYLNLREAARERSKFHADAEPFGRLYYYNGPMENLVREMQERQSLLQDYGKATYDFSQKPEALLETYKKHLQAKVSKCKEAVAQSALSQGMKTYMERELDFQLLVGLNHSPSVLTNEYAMSPGADRSSYGEFFTRISKAIPTSYVDKDLYAVLNEPVSLLNAQYGSMVLESALTGRMRGITEGQFAELVKASKLYRSITDFMPLTDAQKESMEALPEACQQFLNAANDKLLAKIEANKKKTGFRVNETGEVVDEDLFASIISPFRGKVLLVDFWATWCGPCRMANKAMIPMKEALKDKDIVYIYVAGENSPKGTWENMIPDIHGEHFRVTDKQWSYLCDAMEVDGVPSYFVIDREGNIKYKSSGFPGEAKMKEELLKVLGE